MKANRFRIARVLAATFALAAACQTPDSPAPSDPTFRSVPVDVDIADHPWQVLIEVDGGTTYCDGVLVANEWVLTRAGTCAHLKNTSDLLITAGTHDPSTDPGQQRGVQEIVIHPGFKPIEHLIGPHSSIYGDDVALLHLTWQFDMTDPNVATIELADPSDEASGLLDPTAPATAIGFTTGGSGPRLQALDVDVMSRADATDAIPPLWKADGNVSEGQVATDDMLTDRGASLVVDDGGTPLLAGVMNIGWGSPAVHTRVSSIIDWVDATVTEGCADTVCYDGSCQVTCPCPEDSYACNVGGCIPDRYRCDENIDCQGEPEPCDFMAFDYGKISVDEQWAHVDLQINFTDPVVVATMNTRNGLSPATVRVKNVTSSGFDVHIDEWDYDNGQHAFEEVSYLVVERGTYDVDGVRLRAITATVDDAWTPINLQYGGFGEQPLVFAQVTTVNGPSAVTPRLKTVSSTGFQIRLQEEEDNDGTHNPETVAMIIVEPTEYTREMGTFLRPYRPRFHASSTWIGDTIEPFEFLDFMGLDPVVLTTIQTYKGTDPAAVRMHDLCTDDFEMMVEEEASADAELDHNNERVGVLLLEG